MEKYPIRLPQKRPESSEESIVDQPFNKKRVSFQKLKFESASQPSRIVTIPTPEEYLREWPTPPVLQISSADNTDPFPLFLPSNLRYFNEKDTGHHHHDSETEAEPEIQLACSNDDTHFHSHGSILIDKRYVYTMDGTIKDLFFLFKNLTNENDQDDLSLADQVNRQLLQSMARKGKEEQQADSQFLGNADAWNEDEHTPLYWSQRMREVNHFVQNELWSIDPIGDWSFLNSHAVPKDFLRKMRRYFEMRPLEFLRDTGSYRLFHILNQYNDLERIMNSQRSHWERAGRWIRMWTVGWIEKLEPLAKARRMELDYQMMIWLSIWDAKLKANVFQLRETSMTDWFFTWTDWKGAIGVQNLLTKNELHAFDDFWKYRPVTEADEDDNNEEDAEELDNWMAGEEEEEEEEDEIDGGKIIS